MKTVKATRFLKERDEWVDRRLVHLERGETDRYRLGHESVTKGFPASKNLCGSMYSQAWVNPGNSGQSSARCDHDDWKLNHGKHGGVEYSISIGINLPSIRVHTCSRSATPTKSSHRAQTSTCVFSISPMRYAFFSAKAVFKNIVTWFLWSHWSQNNKNIFKTIQTYFPILSLIGHRVSFARFLIFPQTNNYHDILKAFVFEHTPHEVCILHDKDGDPCSGHLTLSKCSGLRKSENLSPILTNTTRSPVVWSP